MIYKHPPIGSNVAVVTRHPSIWAYGKDKWEYSSYSGVVVDDLPWQPPDSFEIRVIECPRLFGQKMPVRTISLRNIESLYVNGVKQEKVYEAPEQRFEVEGSSDTYIVTFKNGVWNCTCPGFRFRRQCKHTKQK